MHFQLKPYHFILPILISACMTSAEKEFKPEADEIQITHAAFGHCLNSTQCFSPDGEQLVYDTRNNDAALAANGQIRVLNIRTGADELVYETRNQTEYGPGVGAATWSPDGQYWLFLGGIQNADSNNPYSFTRRTGIAILCGKPGEAIWMDARDIRPPFTTGALRGGTHAHTWSGSDGWISFTYNDFVIAEAAKSDSSMADLRTIGFMYPKELTVREADSIENKSGAMFSLLLAEVVKKPKPGSNQISKAFDECWIGANGYLNQSGVRIKKAIAYQGNVCDEEGNTKTELFVVDLPDNPGQLHSDAGTERTLPSVPGGIEGRRISFLKNGVSAVPRHWLRSTADGSIIGFYAADSNNIIQLWGISPLGGQPRQLSHLPESASGPFNFSPDGRYAACAAANQVWLVRLSDGATSAITAANATGKLNGAIIWSPNARELAYNRIVTAGGEEWMQIFLAKIRFPGD